MSEKRSILLTGIVTLMFAVVAGCAGQSGDMTAEAAAPDDEGLMEWLTGGESVEVPAGTELTFALSETLSTETNESGDTFRATLAEPVIVDGRELLPSGTEAIGRVAEANESGRVQGRASIRLTMSEVEHDGERYELSTSEYYAVAEPNTGDDAAKIGVGAGIGAAVGAILGGGSGAAKGAAIGGGGGTAVVLATKGDDIEIGAGTRIRFVLDEPFDVSL